MAARLSALGSDPSPPPEVVLIFTRFPYPTETFLQREVLALRDRGVRFRLVSLWGGEESFAGLPVERFNRWRLLETLWKVPLATLRTGILFEAIAVALRRRPPGWWNFWENLLGAGYGVVEAGRVRRECPRQVHAVWASAPAAAAWTLWRLTGVPYSVAAHAYDLYEHGGDWLLTDKIGLARFVRTSTAMAAATLRERGVPADKIVVVRRGLGAFPAVKALRAGRRPLRLVTVARLVEKKGLERQLELFAAARVAGLEFTARLYGKGPLRERLQARIAELGLAGQVSLEGHQPIERIFEALAWADVLVHTGVVAASGDRDGLPNAIPEAMAAGTLVVTSPVAATTEAIEDGQTGLVVPVDDADGWVNAWRRLAQDDAFAAHLQAAARSWVERHFDVHRNMAVLLARLREDR